ncbi:aldehyde dehydrogenase family protein [Caldisphaera sp.]|uniref:aldehyde dehydrogenase family protein n=1 Tax=Caldisphaera sp. TaxID=2060322 RepID=UPI0025C305AE|nr:aldehyde dehydrogenase family protein [Caldisphaera sp.]
MKGLLIEGKEIETENRVKVRSPSNPDNIIDEVSFADRETTKRAIDVALEGFHKISSIPLKDRAKIIKKASILIEERKEILSRLLSLESGKPLKDSRVEMLRAIQLFSIAAEEARFILEGKYHRVDSYEYPPGNEYRMVIETREPIGVVAAILPFNFPANSFAHKVAPNIMAGNSVIVKPSPYTPLTALELGKILYESGLPFESLSVLPGDVDVGDELVTNKKVSGITFTGSTNTGISIASKAVQSAKKLMIEMGGSDPIIVLDDANLDAAINVSIKARYEYAGQNCNAGKRILVHEKIYEKFVSQFIEKARKLIVGDPLEESSDLGPLISKEALEKMDNYVEDALNNGGIIKLGGNRLNLKGYFYSPTVISEANTNMKLSKEEVFGPIAPIFKFSDDNEALEIANSSPFGLQASIFTNDLKRGLRLAKELKVGGVMINDSPRLRWDALPFGGVKLSGIGAREGVRSTIEGLTEIKLISINIS